MIWDCSIFGSGSEVRIPNQIETFGYCSFASFASCDISTIRFESMSKLSLIENQTFYFCKRLQSISIPFSMTIFGENCFADCGLRQIVLFEPDSQLVSLGDSAFQHCFALKSIILPSAFATPA
jgi:hypothetical protein